MVAFELCDVSVGYDEQVVLRSITCSVENKRTTAIIGPGGSGKSTLLELLGGHYAGVTVGMWVTGELRRTRESIAVLPQWSRRPQRRLAKLLSIRSPIDSDPRRLLTDFWRFVAVEAGGVLERNLDATLDALSPSLRRLAEFTLLAGGPENILIMDEPDQGADEHVREWIRAKLCALRGHKTIILVSHNLGIVRDASHDAIFLLDGEIIEADCTARMFSAPRHQRTHTFLTLGS